MHTAITRALVLVLGALYLVIGYEALSI